MNSNVLEFKEMLKNSKNAPNMKFTNIKIICEFGKYP